MSHEIVSMHAHYRSDGTDVHGYLSRPVDAGPWPAVVLVHAYTGMGPHYRDLARRLAREGTVVLAPDIYHGETADDHAEAAKLKTSLDIEAAVTEMIDGAAYLRDLPYVDASAGVLGFCMSGGLALLAAARGDFDAAVAYYPSIYPDEAALAGIDCPLLLHYGTADEVTPASEMANLRAALDDAGIDYEYREYEGADHAFLNDTYEHRHDPEAAAESWEHTVEFFQRHLRT